MTPSESARRRLRSNHACLNCRRKKTRCPGEKPACACCVRLNQSCFYMPVNRAPSGSQYDRLVELEEKMNLILNGNIPTQSRPEQRVEEKEDSHSTSAPNVVPNIAFDEASPQSTTSAIATAIDLYLEHCHRQPVWCFDFEEPSELSNIPEELACSILALTLRFSQEGHQGQRYADTAKRLIMSRIADGKVDLTTIECLCLLSYSSFIDRKMELGRFYLGMGMQLCRSAMLDVESTYATDDPYTERKKRLFWSLQLLEQSYGRQSGLLSVPTKTWRPLYFFNEEKDSGSKPPPLPRDSIGCSSLEDTGIWSMTVHFGWVWSKVRVYVSDCANNRLKEPWRHDSMYSTVLSELTEIENRTPLCHRYDSVQFYERQADELTLNRAYWVPWLKLQFMYHAILTVLNHPFLYIMASQHNSNLAIPNSFWRRSSELVLLHATWIVRMIDMVSERNMRLVDPFFAHVAAIAATVQLYYCCASDPRLKHKSRADFVKCRGFLKTFVPFSHACEVLDNTLDKLLQIACGTQSMTDENWVPLKIHLNIPLMWDILQFNSTSTDHSHSILTGNLLPAAPTTTPDDDEESPSLEIIITTSPEVTVNTTDGGQAVPMPLYRPPTSSPQTRTETLRDRDRVVAPIDSLMLNTPWLWADSSQFGDVGEFGYPSSSVPAVGDIEGSAWWNLGNL